MINLFSYQQPALDAIINAFKRKTAVLAVMATGLGKTIIAAFWAKKEINNGQKGLFICHNNGILDQAIPEFREVLGEKAIFKPFYGPNKDFDVGKANIVFASFQTYVNWKETFLKDGFDFIIVDESHHIQAETYKEVITYFKPKKLLGLTATPDRADLKDIREIFGKEVVDYSLEKSIAEGWLTPVDYHILNDNLNHSKLHEIVKEVLQGSRSVSIKDLNETIFIKKRDEEIARQIREYAGKDKKAIIFCEKIEHAENFQRFLPNSLTYHSKLSDVENKRRLTALREGSLQYILTVNKFNEGIDVPDVEMVVFLRCTESKTIFYQQLGRGLRKNPGKEKVTILDFVANCERLAVVKNMVEKIKEEPGNGFTLNKNILHVTGKAFDFVFSRNQIDILNLIKRINEPFYETWQEAGKAAIKLGILGWTQYLEKYKQDPKLPGNPNSFYEDFPGFAVFLGGQKKEFYGTWQEASKIARKLGMVNYREYQQKYRQDPKLPSSADRIYKDFPGWIVFLTGERRNERYGTWQESSNSAKKLGIANSREYRKKRKQDCRLPGSPNTFYKDFPGWENFLGKGFYKTWQEAGKVARNLGIASNGEYQQKYRQDSRLPSDPHWSYKNFPGWKEFLGTKREFYCTWQEAGIAARKLGILDGSQYDQKYKQNPKLHSNPNTFYKDFPGWTIFLGGEKKESYKTWQEAGKAARRLGIASVTDYREKKKHEQDPKLPYDPRCSYKNFPGWRKFLGTEKNYYKTWQEAGKAAKKIGIVNFKTYEKKHKQDARLPYRPYRLYKDFPGFVVFLGKGKSE